MPTEKIPHLCGGILLGLLLEARCARRKARNKLEGGTDHLSAVDVYAGLIQVVTGDDISAAGRTISKACTLYKTCQAGSGVYVPFTERVTIAAFDAAVKTKNPDLLIRMSEFISSYLNLERCEWLVRALIETIHMDEDIQENEEFLIDYDTVVCADDLPYVSNVVLEPFLISVLHYILLNSPDAESGRATFESWYTQSSKNAEWKLKSDIGSSISPLRVYSRLPEAGGATSSEDSTEERMGAAIITNRADTAPDLALYKNGIFLLEEGIVDPSEDGVETDNEDIRLYLEKIGQKYGTVRTLLNPYQQTPVRNIYVCNDIVQNILVPGRVRNTYAVKFIHNASAQDLAACSNFVIIIGTGGIGKSMMIRHLLLDAIEHYSEDGIVPIFLMLKDYDVSGSSLFEYLVAKIHNFSPGINTEQLTSLLDEGRCLLLLDGLDEVGTKQADTFEKKLEEFIDRFPNNQYVVSSRPHRTFSAYSRFTILKIRPFTKNQALALIDKLECSEDDSSIKEEFRARLDSVLYDTHHQFAENPLLLTIMYMTYELFRDVPSKMHLFYRDAYDALSKNHDALKGLKRQSETGLTSDEFAEWFSEFCARTYYDEKYEFTEYEFTEYFNSLTQHAKRPDKQIMAKAFRDDLCDNLCLMYFESGKYHFTHRSFQEYFCALFFSKQKDRTLEGIGDFFDNPRSRNYGDKTFSMLYDMIPGKIDEYVFIPYLKKLFEECDAGDGYWTFLETMYPQIEFTSGDTEYEAEVSPASFIYEFIRSTFFDELYDFGSLPREDAFIRERYAYVEESDGDQSLVEIGEISYEYQQEYGMSDEVGWLYEVDIGKLREKRFLHKDMLAALDDDSFSLKKEYGAARECLNNLLDKQRPKGHNFFDRFS